MLLPSLSRDTSVPTVACSDHLALFNTSTSIATPARSLSHTQWLPSSAVITSCFPRSMKLVTLSPRKSSSSWRIYTFNFSGLGVGNCWVKLKASASLGSRLWSIASTILGTPGVSTNDLPSYLISESNANLTLFVDSLWGLKLGSPASALDGVA